MIAGIRRAIEPPVFHRPGRDLIPDIVSTVDRIMTLCARLTVDRVMQHTGGVRETPNTVVNQVAVDAGAFKEIHQRAGVQFPFR